MTEITSRGIADNRIIADRPGRGHCQGIISAFLGSIRVTLATVTVTVGIAAFPDYRGISGGGVTRA